MSSTDITQLDITETNRAVRDLLEVTTNPRHRYLLQAYDRHRNLEHAGRFEEIFTPEMIVEHPVYRFNMAGLPFQYGLDVEENAMYLLRGRVAMVWPYDERCRLLGENVWEYDETEHELIKLEPQQVLTTQQAAEQLAPLIEPLSTFHDGLLPGAM